MMKIDFYGVRLRVPSDAVRPGCKTRQQCQKNSSIRYTDAMTQLVLELDTETALKVQEAAERAGLTRDEWLVKLIEGQVGGRWPDPVKQLSGAWPDFPEVKSLREQQQEDVPRETF